jgi:folate-binding protein YgfZ
MVRRGEREGHESRVMWGTGLPWRMARMSPLFTVQEQADAVFLPYAGADEGAGGAGPVRVVGTFGELELEYAAIRKHAAVFDWPHRGVLEVTGADRVDFLNRMLTQELKGIGEGAVRRSFWLNRKGRVDADLRVVTLPGRVLLEMDVHVVEAAAKSLGAFVITEDVVIADVTERVHRLAVHGPMAGALMEAACGVAPPLLDACAAVTIAGVECGVWREDSAGESGFDLVVPVGGVAAVYQRLIELGHDAQHGAMALRGGGSGGTLAERVRLRPAGWHAYNMARIEAGTAWFNIDFGPHSLPVETGVISDRVSFKKGCYLGQEVVARMHARGAGKQWLVGVKFDLVETPEDFPFQPVEGAALFPIVDGVRGEEAVGAVTSSTISPMLGSACVCFAQVRTSHTGAGTELVTVVDGREVRGVVQGSLSFWKRS